MTITGTKVSRDELTALLAARSELGQDYDSAMVDSLADRMEQVVQARTADRLAAAQSGTLTSNQRLTLAVASLFMAMPCSIIAGRYAGLVGVAVTWAGIIVVNVAAAFGRMRRH